MPIETSTAGSDRVFSSLLSSRGIPAPVSAAIQRVLLLDRLDLLYRDVVAGAQWQPPFECLLELLNIRVQVSPEDLGNIPAKGPVVLVANHPFGFIEGCILAAILPKVRPDVKIMANSVLSIFSAISDAFLFVNPFGGTEATRENRKGMRAAVEHLRSGGMLVVFPAGEVSHLDLKQRSVVDPVWNAGVAGFARITGATVVPAFFNGANSALFQLMGLVHPRMRTAMLPHEFLNKQSQELELRIGPALSPERLARCGGDKDAISLIRRRTYLLRDRGARAKATVRRPEREGIIPPAGPELLEADVAGLPESQTLARMGDTVVCYAHSHQIPSVLREIGRLREVTFRAAGEGTGKGLDLDAYDAHYLHLFIWNALTREIVGAYRIGIVDEIRRRHGVRGLYTSTLFRYNQDFLERLGSEAIELGRSFVRPEYQKSYMPLMLLWKGISTWVARNPRYSVLFGPVSISNDYTAVSRELMVSYFNQREKEPELSRMVKARRPFGHKAEAANEDGLNVWDLEELSALIADIETDGKGVPVLLRQYLKLGGKFVSFNVDKQFANALDGLIVVDLKRTERRAMERYMGKAEAAEYFRQLDARSDQTRMANAFSSR